jgi:ABC-type uncharacterized transport system auxiliary subunit
LKELLNDQILAAYFSMEISINAIRIDTNRKSENEAVVKVEANFS